MGLQGGLLFDVSNTSRNLKQNASFLLLGGSLGTSISLGQSRSPLDASLGEFFVETPKLFDSAFNLSGGYLLGDVNGSGASYGYSWAAPFSLGFGSGSASGNNRNSNIVPTLGLSGVSGLSIPLFIDGYR